eukprot:4317031-Alexandrium_andersonii.AAC.1
MRQWESEWWEALGKRASDAAEKHDAGELYRVFKQLRVRGEGKTLSGMRETVPDPDRERQAWATHFRNISEGRGAVAGRVWSNVPAVPQKRQDWLGGRPSDLELDKAVRAMRSGKAAGGDGVVAEALKYGGPKQKE